MKPPYTLDPHQLEFLKWAKGKQHLPLLSDQGTGKTVMGLALIEDRQPERTLILCENSFTGKWAAEVEKFTELSVGVLTGTPSARKAVLLSDLRVVIVGYDTLDSRWGLQLGLMRWDMVIADESTYLKNHRARRTKLAIRYFKNVPCRVIMTGTPITNKLMDLWAQFMFLDGGETFGDSFWWFLKTYFYKAGFEWKAKKGTEEKLRAVLEAVCFRVMKKDVFNLPPKIKRAVGVDLHPVAQKYYDELLENWLVKLPDGTEIDRRHIVAKISMLAQICSGRVGPLRIPCTKRAHAMSLVRQITARGKAVVIWCRYLFEVHDMVAICQRLGVGHTYSIGEGSSHKEVERFQEDPKCLVFISTLRKNSRGITLTKASEVIYYSRDSSLEHRTQSEDRTHRRGSEIHQSITYHDLYTKGTWEETMLKNVAAFRIVAQRVVPRSSLLVLLRPNRPILPATNR